jgi:hypothetical protein
MFAFACVASGFIVACTVFALLVLSGPEFTLSDVARKMETMHRSQPITSPGTACLKTGTKPESAGQSKEKKRAARQPENSD